MEHIGYLCGFELLKRVFLSCRLCCWRFFIGNEYFCLISFLGTLGGGAYESSVDSTIGDIVTVCLFMEVSVGDVDGSKVFGIVGVTDCGIFSILLSCVANTRKLFRIGSPALREGVLDDGGCVNIFTMSEAACFR